MTQNSHDFMDYLGGLETETAPASKNEIDATYAAVLKKAGLKQKAVGPKKAGRIVLIAAAVVVCTVVTVAASGLNIGEMFRGYFEQGGVKKSYGTSAAPAGLTQSQVGVLNRSGSALNISATDNGTTIAVKAVTGDENNAYILFDVAAPEGTKLDRSDYAFARDDDVGEMELTEKGGAKISSGHSWGGSYNYMTLKDADPADNKIQLVMDLHYRGMDLRGKEVRLNLKDITVPDKKRKTEYLPVVKGEWKLTVPLDYTSASKDLTVNRPTHFKPSYVNPKAPAAIREKESKITYQCTVKSISLSSLSATVAYSSDQPGTEEHANPTPFTLTLHFKDGTQADMLRVMPGSAGGTESTCSYLFDTPVDVGSIASVTIGDLTIPVS